MKLESIQGTSNLFDRHTKPRDLSTLRTPQSVRKNIYEASVKPQGNKVTKVDMFVTVKSNYARDRVVVVGNGDLVLNFDRNGIAVIPAHKAYLLDAEMIARPGRYTILQQTNAVAVVEVPAAEVVAETSSDVVTEEVEAEEEVPETKKTVIVKPKGKKISKEND